MLEWIPVADSSVIVAAAYDVESETIYLRFATGKEWYYQACPQQVWDEFTAPGQSKGKYFNAVLKHKPSGPYGG